MSDKIKRLEPHTITINRNIMSEDVILNEKQVGLEDNKKIRIIKTRTFEITEKGQREMAIRILEIEKDGWREISRVSKTGKYKGGKGCCLFLIFAPLALLAGHSTDQVIITFEKYVSEEEKATAGGDNAASVLKDWIMQHPFITIFVVIFLLMTISALINSK